jgi:hypothetical protein
MALTRLKAMRYKVKALLGSDVAIKLEYMPHDIIYTENRNTSSAIEAVAFLWLLKLAISKLLTIRKMGVMMMNAQLLKLNSGKF